MKWHAGESPVEETKLEAKQTEEAAIEKHVPVFNKLQSGDVEIRVGEVLHPMEENHHIMFIQAFSKDKNYSYLKYLNRSDEPKMLLKDDNLFKIAREYCNIHGLWEGNND